MEDTKIITMPVIALRGLTMLPEMTISFDISRKKSIAAVEKAMVGDPESLPGGTEGSGNHGSVSGINFTTLARFLT